MSNAKIRPFAWTLCLLALVAVRGTYAEVPVAVADEVRAAETAFAKSMADRDFAAFAARVADEAIFFGSKGPLVGKAAVLEAWKSLYAGPKAPFSWQPETVVVLASGSLAHSSGPVLDPDGKVVGTFNSVWRRDFDGQWRVVFDKGCDVCNCKPAS
jgi:ketosteroid isomerase-like protein